MTKSQCERHLNLGFWNPFSHSLHPLQLLFALSLLQMGNYWVGQKVHLGFPLHLMKKPEWIFGQPNFISAFYCISRDCLILFLLRLFDLTHLAPWKRPKKKKKKMGALKKHETTWSSSMFYCSYDQWFKLFHIQTVNTSQNDNVLQNEILFS